MEKLPRGRPKSPITLHIEGLKVGKYAYYPADKYTSVLLSTYRDEKKTGKKYKVYKTTHNGNDICYVLRTI